LIPTFVETVSGIITMVIVAAATDAVTFGRRWRDNRHDKVLAWQYGSFSLGCLFICLFALTEAPFYYVRAATDPAIVATWRAEVPPEVRLLLDLRNCGIFHLGGYAIVCGAKLRFLLEDVVDRWWWVPVLLWNAAGFAVGAFLPRVF
jgi:hypothetical protein